VSDTLAQTCEGVADGRGHLFRQGRIKHQCSCFATNCIQSLHVVVVETTEQFLQSLTQTIGRQQQTVCFAGGGKAIHRPHAKRGQRTKEFSEAGAFAAHQLHVVRANFTEVKH